MPDTVRTEPLVHQIWFSDLAEPPERHGRIDALRRLVGPERYRLWTLDAARQLLRDELDADVLRAFDRLRPYAYKADLARYCIVARLGGYYLDLAVSDVVLVDVASWDFVGFRDLNSAATSWKVATNYFYAPAGSVLMLDAIGQVVANCEREYYGVDAHYPTGPSVLGRSVAKLGPDLKLLIGEYIWLRRRRNKYLMPGKRIVGRGKVGGRPNGGVSGVTGGNNYNELWRDRTVYAPPEPGAPEA
ncbi:MAG: hypothetical protein M0Z33_11720 [Actinomycetota bacterium]|nr:hypothetical protein [Actinomycetota bacterium]